MMHPFHTLGGHGDDHQVALTYMTTATSKMVSSKIVFHSDARVIHVPVWVHSVGLVKMSLGTPTYVFSLSVPL